MKREIFCQSCAAFYFPKVESVKRYGKARLNFFCDKCNQSLPIGKRVCAVSSFATPLESLGPNLLGVNWEHGYIVVEEIN